MRRGRVLLMKLAWLVCEWMACGGDPLAIWSGDGSSVGIALDERYVYWASHEPGFVAKIRKPG